MGLLTLAQRPDAAEKLRRLLAENGGHLTTGFAGTYQLSPALTENGMTELAYDLLFNEEYPGWLYEVNLGATTIWERWNSLTADGHVSDTGMNSMNHYCYGSIVEWLFQTAAGLRPDDDVPGFKKAVIAPEPDRRLDFVRCVYDSAAGRYESAWEREGGNVRYTVTVPFDAQAEFRFPDGRTVCLEAGTHVLP